MSRRGLLGAGASCAALLMLCASAPATGTSHRTVASSGGVVATLTYMHRPKSEVQPYSDLRLAIARNGRTQVSGLVRDTFCGTYCYPQQVRVADVEGDGEPDVLLDLYSGGAHCCNISEVFHYDAASDTYVKVEHVWGDPGYKLEHLDAARPDEFVSYDDRFAYEFAAYAFSGLPMEILRMQGGALTDVTASYPTPVSADAATEWRYWLSNRKDGTGLGFLAAWAADEYTLSRGSFAASTLAQLERAGELRSASGYPWVGGAKFLAQLNRFLRKTGYEH